MSPISSVGISRCGLLWRVCKVFFRDGTLLVCPLHVLREGPSFWQRPRRIRERAELWQRRASRHRIHGASVPADHRASQPQNIMPKVGSLTSLGLLHGKQQKQHSSSVCASVCKCVCMRGKCCYFIPFPSSLFDTVWPGGCGGMKKAVCPRRFCCCWLIFLTLLFPCF